MAKVFYGGAMDYDWVDTEIYHRTFKLVTRSRLDVRSIFDGVSELILRDDIAEVCRVDSVNWTVTTRSKESARILSDAGFILCNGSRVALNNMGSQTIDIRVHWLPTYIKDGFLEHHFRRYGIVNSIAREISVIDAQTTRKNGVRTVNITTDELTKAEIPHLIKYDGGIHMLITIAGRPPLCLKCHQLGHLRRDCGATSPTSKRQTRSYASVTKSGQGQQPQPSEVEPTDPVATPPATAPPETMPTDHAPGEKSVSDEQATSPPSPQVVNSLEDISDISLVTPGQKRRNSESTSDEERESTATLLANCGLDAMEYDGPDSPVEHTRRKSRKQVE